MNRRWFLRGLAAGMVITPDIVEALSPKRVIFLPSLPNPGQIIWYENPETKGNIERLRRTFTYKVLPHAPGEVSMWSSRLTRPGFITVQATGENGWRVI